MGKSTDAKLAKRGIDAAARYLELRGYEVIDKDYEHIVGNIDIVAADECGDLHFVIVDTTKHGFPPSPSPPESNRYKLEVRAMTWLREHPDRVDVTCVFDWIAICVIAKDRAFLKHNVNVLQYPDEETMRAAATKHVDDDDSGDEAA